MTSTTTTTSAVSLAWNDLTAHLNKWFYRPDTEALAAALSAGCAHYALTDDPVWMFVIGPSGSGKTSIIINALNALPHSHIIGDVNPHTFISHVRGQAGKEPGILQTVKSGLLLFKDFTTILSKREDERNQIAAILREVYDGRYVRNSGADKTDWAGKMTVIAAATPYLERAWSIKRELGERFVNVRWGRTGGINVARAAAQQRGQEKQIAQTTRDLAAAFCAHRPSSLPQLPPALFDQCATLSEIVAVLRGSVVRDSFGARDIIDIPSIEEPGRLNKALSAICSSHAGLWQRKASTADMAIASRVAWDTIPSGRAAIVHCLPPFPTPVAQADVAELTKIPRSTVAWIAAELEALGVLTTFKQSDGDVYFTVTKDFGELLSSASPRGY